MERGSGSSGRAGVRAAPAVRGGRGVGGRAVPGRLGPCSRRVPEPALKVLSSARAVGEVRESICILAGTWRAGRGVSLLWGLEVRGKLEKEGRQVWGRAARLGELPAQQKGLHEQNREPMYFSVAIQIK